MQTCPGPFVRIVAQTSTALLLHIVIAQIAPHYCSRDSCGSRVQNPYRTYKQRSDWLLSHFAVLLLNVGFRCGNHVAQKENPYSGRNSPDCTDFYSEISIPITQQTPNASYYGWARYWSSSFQRIRPREESLQE